MTFDQLRKYNAAAEQRGIWSSYRDRARIVAEFAARANVLAGAMEELCGELDSYAETLKADAKREEEKFFALEDAPIEQFTQLPVQAMSIDPNQTDAEREAAGVKAIAALFENGRASIR